MSSPKLCIECKNYQRPEGLCMASNRQDLVTGEWYLTHASVMRNTDWCGASAKRYDPINPEEDDLDENPFHNH